MWGGYKGWSRAGKTDKDAKEALARVAKLIKAVPKGQRKLRHDAGSADLTPRPGRSRDATFADLVILSRLQGCFLKDSSLQGGTLKETAWEGIPLCGTGKTVVKNTDNTLITQKEVKSLSGDQGSKRFQRPAPVCDQDLPKSFWYLISPWIDLDEPSPDGAQDMAASETGIG